MQITDVMRENAAVIAASRHSLKVLLDSASHYEQDGDKAKAWEYREAVAIRAVDHPNEHRKEELDAANDQGTNTRLHPRLRAPERVRTLAP